ncbi:MAG TPA: tetratricopeptide repeat protein [Xanthobacteraceae bacterium]
MSARARTLACGLVVGLGVALCAGPAPAQTSQQLDWCSGSFAATGRQRINACTALIDSGRYTGKELARILVDRGDAYRDVLDFEHALADYDKAIALDPKLASAHVGRGEVFTYYVARNDQDQAIVEFNTAMAIDPNDAKAYLGRARAYQRKCGACPDAIRDAGEAVRLAASDQDTLVSALDLHSDLLTIRGDYDGAIRDYDEMLRIDPRNSGALAARGDAFRRKHALDRALADLNAAIGIDAKDPIYFHDRARVYQEMGDLDRAIADYGKAISLKPDQPLLAQILRDRASAYRAKGNADQAVADEAAATRLNGEGR